jgi:hypothetical protein
VVEAIADRPYSYDAGAIDPDNDEVRFAACVKPDDDDCESDTGVLSWSPFPRTSAPMSSQCGPTMAAAA